MSEASSPHTPAPPTDDELQKQLGVQMVDTSSAIRSEAEESADEYINEQTTQGGFKGLIKKIWHGNVARDYIRQREISRAKQTIAQEMNLYAATGGSEEDHYQTMTAVVSRFVDESVTLHQGESNENMDSTEHGAELQDALRGLITSYARGEIDLDGLEQDRTRLLSEYGRSVQADDRNKGVIFADNIVQVAANARSAFESGIALDRIDRALGFKSGEARVGARTEQDQDAASRILEKIQTNKVGSLINETTLAAGVGIAMSVTKWTTRSGASAFLRTASMGAAGGMFAGLRERLRVGQERQFHARQMAQGEGEVGEESGRRIELEATRYDTVAADSLLERFEDLQDRLATAEGAKDTGLIAETVAELAHVRTRIMMSDQLNADLITYTSKASLEQQRYDLDVELAVLTAELQEAVNELSDDQLTEAGLVSRDVNETIDALGEWTGTIIEGDMSNKDRVFQKLRRSRSLKMAAVGFVSGMAIGTAVQELKALASDQLDGLFNKPDSDGHRSALAALLRHEKGSGHQLTEGHVNPQFIDDHSSVALPPGFRLVDTPNGRNLIDANDKIIGENITFNQDGQLSDQSKELLEGKGYKLDEAVKDFVATKTETTTIERTPDEYINAHPEEFSRVNRTLWYDNNTPKFDRNELGLWWGGNGGIDADGNYVFSVAHMTPGGSFHGAEAANYKLLIDSGQMKIAVSLDRGSQRMVSFIDVDSNGNAVIDKDSFIGQSVFEIRDGQAHFTGGFAEAVQVTGTEPDGTTNMRMLATVVGDNNPKNATDTITSIVKDEDHRVITTITPPEVVTPPVEVAPVAPIYARKGLEKLTREEREEQGYYDYNSPEGWSGADADLSPRLRDNPNAILNTGQELDYYRDLLLQRRGDEYVSEIEQQIDSSEVLRSVDNETKAIVCIPVAAKTEGDNIYDTLSLYAQQDPDALKATKILLHVNWIDDQMSDEGARDGIALTRSEIDRAKNDFPELQIATVETEWPREFVDHEEGHKRKGDIIGEVARRLFDAALLSVNKATNDGRRTNGNDVLVIRNDSDAQGMSNNYLGNMIRAFEEHPETDGFTGQIRWETSTHRQYPGFGIVSNFREVMHAVTGLRASNAHVPTVGINTAVRASSLAAIGCIGTGEYIGAGSDDLEVGGRLYRARSRSGAKNQAGSYSSYSSSVKPKRLGLLRKRASYASNDNDNQPDTNEGRPIRVVTGAGIDTAADRLLNVYRQEKPITVAWNDFSGKARNEVGGSALSLNGESSSTDMDGIAKRIEMNLTEMARTWFKNPAQLSLGLRFVFPESDDDGNPIYKLSYNSRGARFRLTPEGKTWLKNRIERDNKGRFDHFGSRVRRRLYSEANPEAKKQPITTRPRFVQPVS